jgi:hypothetical protein
MDHPLYQIEKVLQKGQDNVEDIDDLEAYIEVRGARAQKTPFASPRFLSLFTNGNFLCVG